MAPWLENIGQGRMSIGEMMSKVLFVCLFIYNKPSLLFLRHEQFSSFLFRTCVRQSPADGKGSCQSD